MSPGTRVEVEIRRTEHGPLHVYRCDNCEDGQILTCNHGANCPCRGFLMRCEDCNGTTELVEEGCDCPICMQVLEDMEKLS
jgi:hypothetical protein